MNMQFEFDGPNLREKILIKQAIISNARSYLNSNTQEYEILCLLEHDMSAQEFRKKLLTEQLNAQAAGLDVDDTS